MPICLDVEMMLKLTNYGDLVKLNLNKIFVFRHFRFTSRRSRSSDRRMFRETKSVRFDSDRSRSDQNSGRNEEVLHAAAVDVRTQMN